MIRSNYLPEISRYWWLPLLTGLVCVALGVWTICSPAVALPAIAWAFAICLLAIGITDGIWALATTGTNPHWGWDICLAVIDVIAGIWMLSLNPAQMTMAFLYIIGIWLIFVAFSGLGQIFSVSSYSPAATVLAVILLAGALFFSFWIIFNPIALGVTAWLWLGIALACYGVFKIFAAFTIKSLRR